MDKDVLRTLHEIDDTLRSMAQWQAQRRRAKRNPIRDIIGKWPGDETDEEFDAMMREHTERD